MFEPPKDVAILFLAVNPNMLRMALYGYKRSLVERIFYQFLLENLIQNGKVRPIDNKRMGTSSQSFIHSLLHSFVSRFGMNSSTWGGESEKRARFCVVVCGCDRSGV